MHEVLRAVRFRTEAINPTSGRLVAQRAPRQAHNSLGLPDYTHLIGSWAARPAIKHIRPVRSQSNVQKRHALLAEMKATLPSQRGSIVDLATIYMRFARANSPYYRAMLAARQRVGDLRRVVAHRSTFWTVTPRLNRGAQVIVRTMRKRALPAIIFA